MGRYSYLTLSPSSVLVFYSYYLNYPTLIYSQKSHILGLFFNKICPFIYILNIGRWNFMKIKIIIFFIMQLLYI